MRGAVQRSLPRPPEPRPSLRGRAQPTVEREADGSCSPGCGSLFSPGPGSPATPGSRSEASPGSQPSPSRPNPLLAAPSPQPNPLLLGAPCLSPDSSSPRRSRLPSSLSTASPASTSSTSPKRGRGLATEPGALLQAMLGVEDLLVPGGRTVEELLAPSPARGDGGGRPVGAPAQPAPRPRGKPRGSSRTPRAAAAPEAAAAAASASASPTAAGRSGRANRWVAKSARASASTPEATETSTSSAEHAAGRADSPRSQAFDFFSQGETSGSPSPSTPWPRSPAPAAGRLDELVLQVSPLDITAGPAELQASPLDITAGPAELRPPADGGGAAEEGAEREEERSHVARGSRSAACRNGISVGADVGTGALGLRRASVFFRAAAVPPLAVRLARAEELGPLGDVTLVGSYPALRRRLREQRALGARCTDAVALLGWYLPYAAVAGLYSLALLAVGVSEVALLAVPLLAALPPAHLARISWCDDDLIVAVDHDAAVEMRAQLSRMCDGASRQCFGSLSLVLQILHMQSGNGLLLFRPSPQLPREPTWLAVLLILLLAALRLARAAAEAGFLAAWLPGQATRGTLWCVEAASAGVAVAVLALAGCAPAGARPRNHLANLRLDALEAALGAVLDALRPLLSEVPAAAEPPPAAAAPLFRVRLVTLSGTTLRAGLRVGPDVAAGLVLCASCPAAGFCLAARGCQRAAPAELKGGAAGDATELARHLEACVY